MQIRSFILPLCLLTASTFAWAQNYTDALRYSQFDPIGTARFVGAGGALGALGSDFSVISTNPAGLALLRRSDLVISPALNLASADAQLTGGNNRVFSDELTRFALPNFGMTIVSRSGGNWSTFNFALGLTRLADFNNEWFYRGVSEGSILDRFEEQANSSIGLDPFEAGLAFDADALLEDNQGFFFSDFTDVPGAVVEREQRIQRRGAINELSFAFAGNYRERVMWGLSVGIPLVNYEEEKSYRESDVNAEVPFFDNLGYNESLTATGAGINLKLGVVFRPYQALRLGVAVHTPTVYRFDETFATDMEYNYTFDGVASRGEAFSPSGSFEYQLRTPWRFMAGAGYLFGRSGFLSGEVEYANYTGAAFGFDGFPSDEADANQAIDDNLRGALTARLGGEYAYENFRLRAGVGLRNAALQDDDSIFLTYSLGGGIRGESFFLDLAYRLQGQSLSYVPYRTFAAPEQIVDVDQRGGFVILTLGFKL